MGLDEGEETQRATPSCRKPTIFNLSSHRLTEGEIQLLKNGPKFTPAPLICDKIDYNADMVSLSRKIKLSSAFGKSNAKRIKDTSLIKLPSNKGGPKPTDKNLQLLCSQLENLEPVEIKSQSNMSRNLYSTLNDLRSNDNIVIKTADKGSGVVIMDFKFYDTKIKSMLCSKTYELSNHIDCTLLQKKVRSFANKHKSQLTDKEYEAITKQESYLAEYYGLPKIHKSAQIKQATKEQEMGSSVSFIECNNPQDLTFRPIVACQKCPTKNLCELIDKLLRPYVNKVKFRLKDNWEFLRKLPTTTYEDGIAVTADITSLYTNILTSTGAVAIGYYIDLYPELLPPRFPKEFVISAFTFCQENLYLTYDGTVYRQTDGTGMGKIYAPSLADIKQGYDEITLEERLRGELEEEAFIHFIRNYARYLDDIWLIWRVEWLDKLSLIADIMNGIDKRIKYTFENSMDSEDNSLPYLDVRVRIQKGTIITDLYSKPTDTFNYVPFNSAHPRHVLRNVPYSLARRLRGIVSQDDTLAARMQELKERLASKKYPRKLINDAIKKAESITRDSILNGTPKKVDSTNGENHIYCVTTYGPNIAHPGKQVGPFVDIYNSTRTNDDQKIAIKFSFRKNPSLKQCLMFKKLPGNTGVFHCKDGCTLCSKNMKATETLTLKTGVTLRPNARFECTSRNLVYVIVCGGCQEFYIGETGDTLRNRFAVHRQQMSWKPEDAPVKADPHLRTCGKERYIVFPFFRPSKNTTIYRRAQEQRLIQKLSPTLNRLI